MSMDKIRDDSRLTENSNKTLQVLSSSNSDRINNNLYTTVDKIDNVNVSIELEPHQHTQFCERKVISNNNEYIVTV